MGIKILIGIFHYRSFFETLTMASTISASMIKAPVAARQQTVLTQSKTAKPAMVSNVNAKKTNAFLVWTPTDNKFFETFSFLPALTDDDISKQVTYIVGN